MVGEVKSNNFCHSFQKYFKGTYIFLIILGEKIWYFEKKKYYLFFEIDGLVSRRNSGSAYVQSFIKHFGK